MGELRGVQRQRIPVSSLIGYGLSIVRSPICRPVRYAWRAGLFHFNEHVIWQSKSE